jgi:hypothetical protein
MKRAPKAWTEAQLKKVYGEEYPLAVTQQGIRFPLAREYRFSRVFDRADLKKGISVSRFMDGSVGITLAELAEGWPTWTLWERTDFCQECSWLSGQDDFPEMVRFIMKNGGLNEWSALAQSIATKLPQEEAFGFLLNALDSAEPGKRGNLIQGLALTGHSNAETVLREQLTSLLAEPAAWINDKFVNGPARDAITCIKHLIELGVPPEQLEPQVRRLSEHVCERNRRSCVNFLSKHYPWLKKGPSD